MKQASIARPSPSRPNAASKASTLNLWLAEYHGFDLSKPYSCREKITIDKDGNAVSELIYEQG